MGPAEWRIARGTTVKASDAEIRGFVEAAVRRNASRPSGSAEEELRPLPWSDEEQLAVAIFAAPSTVKVNSWILLAMMLTAIVSFAVGFVRMLFDATERFGVDPNRKPRHAKASSGRSPPSSSGGVCRPEHFLV